MKIYYKSNSGEILDLMAWPYKIRESEFLSHEWSYTGTENSGNKSGGTIKNLRKKIEKKKLTLDIFAMSKSEYSNALERFLEVTEKDVLNEKPGRLYVDDYYYPCFIYASEKKEWGRMTTYLQNELKIVSPYPFWCHELTKSFIKGNIVNETGAKTGKLSYPYRYPYRYSMPQDVGFILNDHYASCDFKMIIYGPCTNPSILINGHLYEVTTTLYTGEYLVVDSRNNTVIRYLNDGRTENLFNWRNKDHSLFEKIPSGHCSVLWNTDSFGFDIVLFQERSEPKWNL